MSLGKTAALPLENELLVAGRSFCFAPVAATMRKCQKDKGKGLKRKERFQKNTGVCKGNSLLLPLPMSRHMIITVGKP